MASWPGVAWIALFGITPSDIVEILPRCHLREAPVPGIYSDSESTTNKIQTARASLLRDDPQQLPATENDLMFAAAINWSFAARSKDCSLESLCATGCIEMLTTENALKLAAVIDRSLAAANKVIRAVQCLSTSEGTNSSSSKAYCGAPICRVRGHGIAAARCCAAPQEGPFIGAQASPNARQSAAPGQTRAWLLS